MAYLHARANIARAGVTYAGYAPANVEFKVNGTVRAPMFEGFSITETLDSSPGTMTFSANPAVYTPSVGQSVTFAWCKPNHYWFAGTILRRSYTLDKDGGRIWRCEAIDNTWLMDRYAKVTAQYRDLGYNSILARIVASSTDGGFRVGYCPSSLGTVAAIDFQDETVSSAIDRLAQAAGAYWFVDADRCVQFFDTLPDGNALTVGNSSALRLADYDEDLSQVRNQTTVLGASSQTTAVVPVSATVIPVDDTRIFAATGGRARAGQNIITYTATSTASGPGDLTGCSGIAYEIAQGEPVQVEAQSSDSAAQTTLASTLGGGLSGVAAHVIVEDELTDAEARAVAAEDVANFSATLQGFQFETTGRYTQERFVSIGKTLSVSLTSPATLSGTFRIQNVTITVRRYVPGSTPEFTRRANARALFRRLATLFPKHL